MKMEDYGLLASLDGKTISFNDPLLADKIKAHVLSKMADAESDVVWLHIYCSQVYNSLIGIFREKEKIKLKVELDQENLTKINKEMVLGLIERIKNEL